MCLSTVYLDIKDTKHVFAEDASSVTVDAGSVKIATLFGAPKIVSGYTAGEINLLEHYVVLVKTGAKHAAKKRSGRSETA